MKAKNWTMTATAYKIEYIGHTLCGASKYRAYFVNENGGDIFGPCTVSAGLAAVIRSGNASGGRWAVEGHITAGGRAIVADIRKI